MKLVSFLILLLAAAAYPQELNCRVIVNYEGLPVINRELLPDFGPIIEDYLNKTRFTNQNWEGDKIDCTFNIFFTSASSETNYSAQVVVVSQRSIYKSINKSAMLTINDGQWSFSYERGQALYAHQASFDPLTSFLDFYAYVIIGFDMDSWELLGGTPYFSKAMDIINLGAASRFSAGWERSSAAYSRRGLVEDILNEKYRPFREAIYQYHYGIDLFEQNKAAGQQRMVTLINTLEEMRTKTNINSVFVRTFFDVKSGEIIDRLRDYDKEIFKTLKRLDPARASRYDEVLK